MEGNAPAEAGQAREERAAAEASAVEAEAEAEASGPTIVVEQRRDDDAARSYSRRSFGNFNKTVEATAEACA